MEWTKLMSKAIFFRRVVNIPVAGLEYTITWEQDQIVPLCLDGRLKVAMFTNGANRIAISVASNAGNLEAGTSVYTYVDPISCDLWQDFMDTTKIVNYNRYSALSLTILAPGQIFLQAPCAFETMKVTIVVPNPITIVASIVGWNSVSDQ